MANGRAWWQAARAGLRRKYLAILALVLAGGLGAFGVWIAFGGDLGGRSIEGGALLVAGAAVLVLYLSRLAWIKVGMAAVAPWIPVAAASFTLVSLFLLPPDAAGVRSIATLAGLIGALVVWLGAAMFAGVRSTPRTANARAYAAIVERVRSLKPAVDRRGAEAAERSARAEASAHIDHIVRVLGMDPQSLEIDPRRDPAPDHVWATGSGYQELWTALHRAEEALIATNDAAGLRQQILRDRLRLRGSKLNAVLSDELDEIQRRLPKEDNTKRERAAVREFAAKLQVTRRSINEFRDGRWDGLVNARAALSRSTLITSWTAYAIAVLAITLSAPREALAAAAVYFAVGALIGLVAQLRADAKKDQVVEDYGLSAARLNQTVLASGLAGVAGVVLVAIGAEASDVATGSADLKAIFDLANHPGQLLVAAVFGLSPSLLLDRLTAKAETYKQELTTTQIGDEPNNPEVPAPQTAGDG
jgi:hypothetical protein